MLAGIAVTIVACDNMANQPKRLPFELPARTTSEANWPASPPANIVARDEQPVTPPALTLALLASASISPARRVTAAPATGTA